MAKANERARIYNDPKGDYGTIGYWLDRYISDAAAGLLPAGRRKKPRTIADNRIEAEYIKASPLGKMYPGQAASNPQSIAEYRDRRVDSEGRGKTRANRELSLLSALYSWLLEKNLCPGLAINPVRLVTRFSETPKDRYVDDLEYTAVFGIAQRSVCMALELTYRTLQRPGDLLNMAPSAVRQKSVGGVAVKVLSVKQSKTGATVDIQVTPELEATLAMLSAYGVLGRMQLSPSVTKIVPTLVHTIDGQPYTEDGIGAMLRRYCNKAGVKTFGLMDVRAKGATDMYQAGIPLEHIQMLMGHESVTTTEIYIKRMLSTVRIARPNAIAISA